MKFLPRRAAAFAVAALVPVLASAQQPPQGPPPAGGRGGVRAAAPARAPQRAQLTEEQRGQMRAFDEQQRQALETSRRELGDLHRQLNEALTSAQIDSGKVNSLRAAIVQKETALAQARVDRLAKMSSILTAEQRQALRGRGLGEAFGRGGGPAPGAMRGQMRGQLRGQMRGPVMRGGQMRGEIRGQMRGQVRGQMRGAGRGMIMQRRPGLAPGGALETQQLRNEIRRLEAQIEALRRRIR